MAGPLDAEVADESNLARWHDGPYTSMLPTPIYKYKIKGLHNDLNIYVSIHYYPDTTYNFYALLCLKQLLQKI